MISCPRCQQTFASNQRLKTHLEKAKKCEETGYSPAIIESAKGNDTVIFTLTNISESVVRKCIAELIGNQNILYSNSVIVEDPDKVFNKEEMDCIISNLTAPCDAIFKYDDILELPDYPDDTVAIKTKLKKHFAEKKEKQLRLEREQEEARRMKILPTSGLLVKKISTGLFPRPRHFEHVTGITVDLLNRLIEPSAIKVYPPLIAICFAKTTTSTDIDILYKWIVRNDPSRTIGDNAMFGGIPVKRQFKRYKEKLKLYFNVNFNGTIHKLEGMFFIREAIDYVSHILSDFSERQREFNTPSKVSDILNSVAIVIREICNTPKLHKKLLRRLANRIYTLA